MGMGGDGDEPLLRWVEKEMKFVEMGGMGVICILVQRSNVICVV